MILGLRIGMLNEIATPKGLGLLGRPFAGPLYGGLTPSGSGRSERNDLIKEDPLQDLVLMFDPFRVGINDCLY